MALTIQVAQTADLTFTPRAVGVDPARITKTRWAPVGADQTKVKWTSPNHVEGMAPGVRDFKVAVTCAALVLGDPEETLTYGPFAVTCVTAGPAPAPIEVPVVLDNIVTPPA